MSGPHNQITDSLALVEKETPKTQQAIESDREEEEFQAGELVWAKITGYPWWPGVVAAKQKRFSDCKGAKALGTCELFYKVNFMGTAEQ